MIVLLFFSFLSGLVTIFAPCIWPLLPIILSSSATGGKLKPLGVVVGIVVSFTVFTLSISYIVRLIPFDPNGLRLFSALMIGFLGLSLAIPAVGTWLEFQVSRLSSRMGGVSGNRHGFWGGIATGALLGLVWTPCAGPILASVATAAATRTVGIESTLITLAYTTGVGVPLFIITTFSNRIFTQSRFLSKYTGRIQQVFGVVMIIMAIAIYTGFDRTLQTVILDKFPSYSRFLTQIEDNSVVQSELNKLRGNQNSAPSLSNDNLNVQLPYQAPKFTGIENWLNTENGSPLTLASLKGKVVLIDFWTYTCINCINTLPYVTGWYEKYKDMGFVVVGVHTPEFEFEKKTENVQGAIKQYNITYPVAQDNDYKTWRTFDNHYWPAHYLIDATGKVRRIHFGEGEYDKTEIAIQALLKEAGAVKDVVAPTPILEENRTRISPETYLGLARRERFAGKANLNEPQFDEKLALGPTNFVLAGNYTEKDEFVEMQANSQLWLGFIANKVFLVLAPSTAGEQMRVLLDGKPISQEAAGADVDSNGIVTVDRSRLFELVNLKGDIGSHILKLEFMTGGTQVFAFTFGK